MTANYVITLIKYKLDATVIKTLTKYRVGKRLKLV